MKRTSTGIPRGFLTGQRRPSTRIEETGLVESRCYSITLRALSNWLAKSLFFCFIQRKARRGGRESSNPTDAEFPNI